MIRLVILISNAGTGSNLQAIIDAIKNKKLKAIISVVVSSSKKAQGLKRAKKNNIPALVLKKGDSVEKILEKYATDYIVLAGWIRVISKSIIDKFKNRIINIHPGLIPDRINETVKTPDGTKALWNRGKMTVNAVRQFLDQSTYAGSSIHFLTQEFDFGPVLARDFEKIKKNDTVGSLYKRLKSKEHKMLIAVLINLSNKSTTMKRSQKYALISVYDKTGIVDFAKQLHSLGYKIISTGGTGKVLKDHNILFVPIQEITGNPESFDGRMKTISFEIESGILYDRKNKSHQKQASELGIKDIDMVVCNLYPFEKTISKKNVKLDEAIENIDVGGPTMLRAAAKNFKNVLVVVDPDDYENISGSLMKKSVNSTMRQNLAAKAFSHLSFYDSQIASYLDNLSFPRRRESTGSSDVRSGYDKSLFPEIYTIPGRKLFDLRYGENPHQSGAVYIEPNSSSPFAKLQRLAGRKLSLINVTDINAGLESLQFFKEPAAVVLKHNSPCGISLGKNAKEALAQAIESDPESAFGGVIVMNKPMDKKIAEEIVAFKDERHSNIDIVAVPEISNDALELLKKLRKTLGIYTFGNFSETNMNRKNVKPIQGGFVLQDGDIDVEKSLKNWEI
ncbi:hypothetical protein A3F59_06195, partial [Candidatus Roizmanbacteria bacterium RIFCSPHIGHO2_12_FULL_38_13]